MTATGGAGGQDRQRIHLASAAQQLSLPGTLWPAGCGRGHGDPLFFSAISKDQANELLAAFGHPLGEFDRPFGYQAWGLAIDGQAAAVAVSGSTVGATSAGYRRQQVVDLARIARHPDHPGIMRVMLRLWRDYLGPRWDYWDKPVQAAVSYALPGKEGNLYRFDGWKSYGDCKPWTGGGTWSNPSRANDMGNGVKKLYYYAFPSAARDIAAMLARAGFDLGCKSRKRGRTGFIVTSSGPGAVRVRHHSIGMGSALATARHAALTAYARAISAAGFRVVADHDLEDLVVTAASAGQGTRR